MSQERLLELHQQIKYHNDLFFKQNTSEISDAEFDVLFREYKQLESQYPGVITEEINLPMGETKTDLDLVSFKIPMISLDKALNHKEYEKFKERLPADTTLDYEYKLDGLALEATYEYGTLTELKTRYDGSNGESVMHNLELFNETLPLYIKEWEDVKEVLVRGEAFLTIEDFNVYNNYLVTKFKTPRNGVAGLVRRSKESYDEHSKGMVSYNIYWSNLRFDKETYSSFKKHLKSLGFTFAPSASERYIKDNRRIQTHPIDGIVVKVDEFKVQEDLGERQNNPRWAVAYKFPPETSHAILKDVIWQVAASGTVTPVAFYPPIMLGGVENTRATLFNYRHFNALKLREGSTIEITRNGDVIPYLAHVLNEGNGKLLKAPKECPSCGSVLVTGGVSDDSVKLVCENTVSCPAQLINRIDYYLGKHGLNINGISFKTIEKWVESGVVTKLTDIYEATEEELGERFYNLIHDNKTVRLDKFINALSLPGVGIVTAKDIAKIVKPDLPLLNVLQDNIIMFSNGVRVDTSLEVADLYKDEEMLMEFEILTNLLTIEPLEETKVFGKVVYLTGTTNISRKELKRMLEEHDIELSDKFNNKTDCLLIGSKPGDAKVKTAKRKGIRTIDVTTIGGIHTLVDLIKE